MPEALKAIRETTASFVEEHLPLELVRAIDDEDRYPSEPLAALVAEGYMGINIDPAYGGWGGNILDAMALYEEISRRLPVLAWVVGNICLYGGEIIGKSGSEAQRRTYLPRLARGEIKFGFALTEPDSGSDAASLKTRAERDGDGYRIYGRKMFITGAGVSDYVLTMARTSEDRYRGITAFIVAPRAVGYSARELQKLGYRGSNTCAVSYEGVRVGPEHILGGPEGIGHGWEHMVRLLNQERLTLAACAVGIGRAVLEDAIEHVRRRFPGGAPQGVQHRVAEMATELEAARSLAYAAARLEADGLPCGREASMAKYFATDTGKRLAVQGMDLLGGEGAESGADMQRHLRNVLVLTIGGGTSEIQKNIIARQIGL